MPRKVQTYMSWPMTHAERKIGRNFQIRMSWPKLVGLADALTKAGVVVDPTESLAVTVNRAVSVLLESARVAKLIPRYAEPKDLENQVRYHFPQLFKDVEAAKAKITALEAPPTTDEIADQIVENHPPAPSMFKGILGGDKDAD